MISLLVPVVKTVASITTKAVAPKVGKILAEIVVVSIIDQAIRKHMK